MAHFIASCSELQVAYDPLDGSSIFPANLAVGTIIGIWPGDQLVGRQGKEQCAAAYALYGPRTVLVLARPSSGNRSTAVCLSVQVTQQHM